MILFERAVIHGGDAIVAVIDGSEQARGWLAKKIGGLRALDGKHNDDADLLDLGSAELEGVSAEQQARSRASLARPRSLAEAEMHVYGTQPYNRVFCACEIRQYGTNDLRQCRRVPGHGPEKLFCLHHAAAMALDRPEPA